MRGQSQWVEIVVLGKGRKKTVILMVPFSKDKQFDNILTSQKADINIRLYKTIFFFTFCIFLKELSNNFHAESQQRG